MKLMGGGKEEFNWDLYKKVNKDLCDTNLVKNLLAKKK